VLVGDSITVLSNLTTGVSGLTRDVAGLVTGTATIKDTPGLFIPNPSDPTFRRFGNKLAAGGSTFQIQTPDLSVGSSTAGALNLANQFPPRGMWRWFQGLMQGGLRFLGNFGEGGTQDSDWVGANGSIAQSLLLNPDIVVLGGDVNGIFTGGKSAAQATLDIQACIDQVIAAGKKVLVLGTSPPTTSYTAYTLAKMNITLTVNANIAAYCAARSATTRFVDICTAATLYDTVAQGAYNWVTSDTLHWTDRAGLVVAQAMQAAVSGWLSTTTVMPLTSSDVTVINHLSKIQNYGAWSAASGGSLSAGMSGVAPPGRQWERQGGTGTGVCTIFDGGDTFGFWAQCAYTPGGTDAVIFHVFDSTAIASLGLAVGDTCCFAMELSVSNAQAANLKGVSVTLNGNGGSAFSIVWGQFNDETNSIRVADTYSVIALTGPVVIPAGTTTMDASFRFDTFAAGAAVTVKIRRSTLFKVV
jgi:hypothetical protein